MANRRAKQPHNHGDSLREELRNGKAEWQLAGSEEVAVAYLGVGKIYENGRNLRLAGCFYMRRRERERGVEWSRTSVTEHCRRARLAEPGSPALSH
jgi:hypothetical protein